MLTGLVAAGSKALGGARFSLVNVMPGVLLVGVVLGAAWSGAYGGGPVTLDAVADHIGDPVQTILLVFGLFLAGVVIQPFQLALVQFLEGYWGQGAVAGPVGAVAAELHRRRLHTAALRSGARAAPPASSRSADVVRHVRAEQVAQRIGARAIARRAQYPEDAERVMPTLLGNILRGAEDAAGSRYGLDALTVYPRMYPSISKPLQESMTRQLDAITLGASMCVSFALILIATAPLIVLRSDAWSLIPVAALVLAVVSYRGALRAAASHGALFAAAFDLHRFDLIRALHYRLPETADEEWELNTQLTEFLQQRGQAADCGISDQSYDHAIYKDITFPTPEQADPDPADEPSADEPDQPDDERSDESPPTSPGR
ncbi:hypothetical protein [Pseudonocardia lacus]|uniref:hypothetical protein n=1 Tax=Pseudonocardia lacus TaxID=2835865 RepID=UPI001BDBCEB5|nr:hypothetical protein [Pseudonocardia lacus]